MGKCVVLLILLVALAMRSAANSGHWAKTPMIQEWKGNLAVSDRAACMFSSGDGTGGDEEQLGVVDTAEECVELVLAERPHANGVTFGVPEGGRAGECYAEIGMVKSDGAIGKWQTCILPVFKKINQREIDEHEIMKGPGRGKGEECDYFLREDLVTAPGPYDIGTAGCTGDSECQFKTLSEAKHFCSFQADCKTIVKHIDVDGTHCAGGLGCFTPRNGEPEVGGVDTVYEYLCKDCSCTDVTAKGYGQKIYGNCENEEVLDAYGKVVNTGWWIYGPLCYVNEPTTCPEARKYRRSSLNQMIFSWEACELNYSHMDVWEEKWLCKNNVPQGMQTQLACQQLCVDDPLCVGISHDTYSNKHLCFLCHDEIMEPIGNDHGEYFRMPPPIHCEYNDWVLGECSATCGYGTRIDTRDKKVVEQYRGTCSNVFAKTEMCIDVECPVDCEWNDWVLGDCSQSCGGGTRTDTRTKNVTEEHGGECDQIAEIEESCNVQECPVDCYWGQWVHNEGCVLDNGRVCGDGGIQKSTRSAVIDLLYPGKPCEGVTEKEESCSIECPDCSWKNTGGCAWTGDREPENDKSCDETIRKDQSGYCECGDDYGTRAMKKGCETLPFETCALACAGCTGGDTCCTATNPCNVDQGDCDTDEECKTGLRCGTDNCSIKTGLEWDATDDCCYAPDTSKVWHEKTFVTAGDTCSKEERVYQGALDLAACKVKAEGYGNANFIYFQSADDRPQGVWCHIYTSCENTRAPSEPGTNYEFVTYACPDGYGIGNGLGCCPGTGDCCIAGWTAGCGEGCMKGRCEELGGTWIAKDYSLNPYTCEMGDCAEHDKDFYGNDLNSDENDEDYALGAGKRDSVGQCQALCQSRDGCEFFTYKTSNKECWLKTSNSGSGYQSGAISGPKSCV